MTDRTFARSLRTLTLGLVLVLTCGWVVRGWFGIERAEPVPAREAARPESSLQPSATATVAEFSRAESSRAESPREAPAAAGEQPSAEPAQEPAEPVDDQSSCRVWGTLVDALGEPLPGVPMALASLAMGTDRGKTFLMLTEPDGSFECAGVPPGEYRLLYKGELRPAAPRPIALTLAPGSRTYAGIVVVGGGEVRVEGRIVSASGGPLGRVQVSCHHDSGPDLPSFELAVGTTDADGRFRFDDLEPGPILLRVESFPVEGGALPVRAHSLGSADLDVGDWPVGFTQVELDNLLKALEQGYFGY